jgi:Protein of unknown function (DUF1365)
VPFAVGVVDLGDDARERPVGPLAPLAGRAVVTATRGDGGQGTVLRALAPALYDVEVRHVRHAALHRDFRHRVYLWLVDLDALPRLPFWLRPFARFRAADHLGDPRGTLRGNLDRYLAGRGIDLRGAAC